MLDISKGGAALELQPDEHMDGILALELYAFGDTPRDIALRGEIRHASRLPSGALRVGVEFVGDTAYEVQLIDVLLSLLAVS